MSDEILKAVREHAEAVKEFKKEVRAELDAIHKQQDMDDQLPANWIKDPVERAKKQAELDAMAEAHFSGRTLTKSATIGGKFADTEQLLSVIKGANSTGRVDIPTGSLIQAIKADLSNTTYNNQPNRVDGLFGVARRKLSLIDLLPGLDVTSQTFEFVRIGAYTSNAAVQVAEGDAKAKSDVPSSVISANISTIAHYTKASLQVLSDASALMQQVNNLLRYGVLDKLENELINGAGTAGKISGLLTQATAATTGATANADKIGQAKTQLESAGWMPGMIVLNPTNWFTIMSERSADGYVLGSPRDPAPASLWGVPVVTSPSLAAGTALVLDPQQTALLQRQQVTMAASREDGANFTTNMVTILAELRAGLAVFAPAAVLKVTLV
jgi:HK97 family phage major capsid protein